MLLQEKPLIGFIFSLLLIQNVIILFWNSNSFENKSLRLKKHLSALLKCFKGNHSLSKFIIKLNERFISLKF